MKTFTQIDVEPIPTDGRWTPTKAYYAIGQAVRTINGWDATVKAYQRNQYGRISYLLDVDANLNGSSEWLALTEDLLGGPWNRSDEKYSHNVEVDCLPRGACTIKTCVIHV
jgi:hypothetical protein